MPLPGFYFAVDAEVQLYSSVCPYWGETAFPDIKEAKCKEDQPVQRGVWNAGRIPAGSRPLRPAQIGWGDRSAGIRSSPGSAWRPGAWCHVKILVTHVRIKSGVRSRREHAGGPTDCPLFHSWFIRVNPITLPWTIQCLAFFISVSATRGAPWQLAALSLG